MMARIWRGRGGGAVQRGPAASSDNFAAMILSRPAAACCYLNAALGVVCPSRAISSARVAPVDAAMVAPVWRRS